MDALLEKLMALQDGELSPEQERDVRELLEKDPEAQHLMQLLARADQEFTQAHSKILDLPVPQSLIDSVQNTETQPATIVAFPAWRKAVSFAAAAGLAAVLVTGTWPFGEQGSPVDLPLEQAAYASLLQQTLEQVSSGETRSSENGLIKISPMLSFQTADAAYCREFMAQQGETELAGLACRNRSGNWDVLSQRQQVTVDSETYRAAEGAREPSIDNPQREASQESNKTITLSYEQEQMAIQSGWESSGY